MIFLVRHGEAAAAWGHAPDPGLSELGRKQSDVAAADLLRRGAASAVTSPMQRCRETSQPFAASAGVDVPVSLAVSEIATPSDIEDRPAWLRSVMAGAWSDAGSDYVAWRNAAVSAVDALPNGAVVFSHFVAINAIVSALQGRDDVIVFRPANCSITVLERNAGVLTVAELGDEAPPVVL